MHHATMCKMRQSEAISRLRAAGERVQAGGVRALYLFGSVARDEATPESDLDVFVDPDYERFGFVELIRLEAMLSSELGLPVDLTTRDGLHPDLRAGIERDAIRVL